MCVFYFSAFTASAMKVLGYYFTLKYIFSGLIILKNNCVQQSSITSKLLYSTASHFNSAPLPVLRKLCCSSCCKYMTQREKNHKPKSNQYIFINETRLCGSLASPLILQTNLVYNSQISCGCFCASKGGTWEDRALQAPPVSVST